MALWVHVTQGRVVTPALIGCAFGGFSFALFLVTHVAVLHWRKGAEPTAVLGRSFLAALLAGMIGTALTVRNVSGAPIWLAECEMLLTATSLFVLYGPFFYSTYTSLSIETLLILAAQTGRVPTARLNDRFVSRDVFQARLNTMMANGYLVCEAGSYRVTAKGRNVARVFQALKRLWRLGAGG